MSGTVSAEPLWQLTGVQLHRASRPWPEQLLTVSIRAGRTAVLGRSGAGKTTFLNLLVGFLQAERGSIRRPSELAWVPQNHGLWLKHQVIEHLTLCGASQETAESLLFKFDLSSRALARAGELSMGEAARLAVARALAQDAAIFVMDEPLAHVDAARVGKYWDVIREHLDQRQASLVFATHAPEIAIAHGSKAICVEEGSVSFCGSMHTLYHAPPTAELASQLGPANWLSAEEVSAWLRRSASEATCIRPERLIIEPVHSADVVVTASRFLGSYAETEVRSPRNEVRTFFHRPAHALSPGTKVQLQEVPRV